MAPMIRRWRESIDDFIIRASRRLQTEEVKWHPDYRAASSPLKTYRRSGGAGFTSAERMRSEDGAEVIRYHRHARRFMLLRACCAFWHMLILNNYASLLGRLPKSYRFAS